MTTRKLWLAALLSVLPATAIAQPSVNVDVGVNAGDNYDTTAPGDPVEDVDVFYDQMQPYGVWVDEPDVGRVFIPDTANYVPYTNGHWQYTNLGFVWVSNEPHAWATSHYGRWAYSNNFGRWYWLPDTEWGPAWVEWRETGTDYGWAPLAPEVVIRAGWRAPVETWHYCGSAHILDPNVGRYYYPRERVVEIHRQARPLEHYSTVGRVRVVVGPPAGQLRERHITVQPVRVEARTIGRWSPGEAHAQVERAREHHAAFEAQNQHRIEGNVRIHTAQTKVIETHPQVRAQVNARVQVGGQPRPEEHRPGAPARVEPNHAAPRPGERPEDHRPEPNHAAPQPRPDEHRPEPQRAEPNHPAPQPRPEEHRPAPQQPPQHAQPQPPPQQHQAPPAQQRPPEQHQAPPAQQRPPEQHQAPPAQQHQEPPQHQAPPAQHPEPHKQPEHKEEHH